MYRVKSNAVWHSLPGTVAAYQPIVAPDPFRARSNVAHGGARFGVYTATPGVLPTWNAAMGWTGTGTQWLNTGIDAYSAWTIISRFSNVTTDTVPIGATTAALAKSLLIGPRGSGGGTKVAYFNKNFIEVAPNLASGVLGIAGLYGYRNGIQEAGPLTGFADNIGFAMYLLAYNGAGTASSKLVGSVQAVSIYSRILSATEMWLASRQMAYCEKNPDWNAWARRRRYYYAPSQAGFQAAWAARRNTLIGGGM